MKYLCLFSSLAGIVLLTSGCATHSILEQPTSSARPAFGNQEIPVPPAIPMEAVNPDPTGANFAVFTQVQGTWSFTTPPTVTRVERKNGDIDQFSLFMGRPKPSDTPFLVITVSRNRESTAQADTDTYQFSDHREYVMNGGIVQEWSGLTKSGASFCELIIRKPGREGETGDVCHAFAIARTPEEQQVALSILRSIIFKPTPG